MVTSMTSEHQRIYHLQTKVINKVKFSTLASSFYNNFQIVDMISLVNLK